MKTWHYYDDYFTNDDGVIERHDGEYHQKRKTQRPIKMVGLVHVRRRKKRDRKIVEINIDLSD